MLEAELFFSKSSLSPQPSVIIFCYNEIAETYFGPSQAVKMKFFLENN